MRISDFKDEIVLIKQKLRNFSFNNIYKFDETSLYFEMLQKITFSKNNKRGILSSKKRLTIGFLVNLLGNQKFKPVIIGKSANPRDFKNNDINKICYYYGNNNSWMTSTIFSDLLT